MAWRRASERDAASPGGAALADPRPERRCARLLAGFIAAGLVFMVLPGTLLGVWNLFGISANREADSVSRAWIQAHGHAQLFGWLGSFVIGITPYTFAISVLLACIGLRIFQPSVNPAKTMGVDRRYPWFVRIAFAWLVLSTILAFGASWPGALGASRHAYTVGFLATLVFSVGPRILPSFLNSRELRSPRLMLISLLLVTAGCTLRVTAEPLAYSKLAPGLWSILPVSATPELAAVILFAANLAATMLSPAA